MVTRSGWTTNGPRDSGGWCEQLRHFVSIWQQVVMVGWLWDVLMIFDVLG
jgi:hypothetical protein